MKECEKCQTAFTWMDIFKLQWKKNSEILRCTNCGTEHEQTRSSKIAVSLLIGLASGVIVFFTAPLHFLLSILVIILFFIVLSALSVFIIDYRSKYHSNYNNDF
ncbi:TIGR04104 family putative zinc finger protein [Jeotgalibacillus campisalis]|uniref:TIGR04104 family putative zinc finger protein n=1 Tax=Jeotgalibacillus campisalis TaxID=220754 RepID=UPI000596C60E|nr:TIGR04104 family putative zinc finger protein [Jeotgalibacillus campisalis]